MSGVPYTFASATSSIPLSELDTNFATPVTIGTTSVALGNTVTTLANVALANVTISSVASGIPNNFLANSSVTIGNTSVALGNTVTSLGNVTLTNVTIQGGTSNVSTNSIVNGTSNVAIASANGAITMVTNGNTAVTIDTAQNVGVGVTPSAWVSTQKAIQIGASGSINGGTNTSQVLVSSNRYYNGTNDIYINTNYAAAYQQLNGVHSWYTAASGTAGNPITFTTAMTLDNSGNLLVGTTTAIGKFTVSTSTSNQWTGWFTNASSSAQTYGINVNYTNVAPNNTSNYFLFCSDSGANRFYVASNGGIYNYSANNSNLSDQTMKKDINPAGNYLDKLNQIPVKTFLFNDQTDNELNLGVIAQDVQAVAPELVTQFNIGTDEKPEYKLSIYETDLKYAMLKSIQELSAQVTTLQAKVTALEAKVGA